MPGERPDPLRGYLVPRSFVNNTDPERSIEAAGHIKHGIREGLSSVRPNTYVTYVCRFDR